LKTENNEDEEKPGMCMLDVGRTANGMGGEFIFLIYLLNRFPRVATKPTHTYCTEEIVGNTL